MPPSGGNGSGAPSPGKFPATRPGRAVEGGTGAPMTAGGLWKSPRARFALKALASAALLAWLIRQADMDALGAMWRRASLPWLAASTALLALAQFLSALKLRWFLGEGPGLGRLTA